MYRQATGIVKIPKADRGREGYTQYSRITVDVDYLVHCTNGAAMGRHVGFPLPEGAHPDNKAQRDEIESESREWSPSRTKFVTGANPLPSARDYVDFVQGGWTEGTDTVAKLQDGFMETLPAPQRVMRQRVRRDQGDELDIHRVWRGQLDTAWSKTIRAQRLAPRPLVILGGFGHSAVVKASDLHWSGLALAALVDLAESAGFSCDVVHSNFFTPGGGRFGGGGNPRHLQENRVISKRAGEPLRLSLLASLAHSAAFRLFGISLIEESPFAVGDGHGRPAPTEAGCRVAESLGMDDAPDIVVPLCTSEARARRAIAEGIEVLRQIRESLDVQSTMYEDYLREATARA